MEQKVEQFWVRGEAETIASWVLALPPALVREHARLLLTTALYLLNTVTQTTREQRERRYQQAQRLMARVESVLPFQVDELSHMTADTGTVLPTEALEALLHRRLHLLHAEMAWYEALATWEHERLGALYQEIQELDQDEEVIWQLIPLMCRFTFHYMIRQEGARLLPQLLSAKDQVSRSASPFASLKIRQYLVRASLEAGQLRLAYRESQTALDLIEQEAGYVLLKGYFEITQIEVLYQWNRLEEARCQLHTLVQDATAWQHVNLLARGYIEMLQVALATEDQSLAEFALDEMEQLMQREHYGDYPGWLPTLRAQWWLAQKQIREASDWAASVFFPEGAWDRGSHSAFPIVVRVYFAQHRFREALSLLERWSGHLDRPTNVRITMTYLAQSLVALHQTGNSEQARMVAMRLFALTEPEGYIRVYLDEGEPMREALLALLPPHSQQHEWALSTRTYIVKLLAAFKQEQQGASTSQEATNPPEPAPSRTAKASAVSLPQAFSLTQREQEVLRLLATGASNQEIAHTLVISLPTVKKHVSNLLGKLGATNRTQALREARANSLL
jgi:LuxR family maltose regulon positive regulatory protein